jgi:hypothetical protein
MVKRSLIMRLSCGNTPSRSGGAAPFGCGHIKRFRRSSVVHGYDRDESRLDSTLSEAAPQAAEISPPLN